MSAALSGSLPDRRLIELSHVIGDGVVTYPGLPAPEISPFLSRADSVSRYAPGTTFTIDWIRMVGNTGTYVDSPFHRYEDGDDLATMPLASVADLPIALVRLEGGPRAIEAAALVDIDPAGCAVLLLTGWDKHFGTAAYGGAAPFLTADGARSLADRGAVLVGIDSVNIDSTEGNDRPAHSILLAARIPVLEHLTNLAAVPDSGARLHAAPVRVKGFGTFPVRAYAVVTAS
jgi:kynurenine formamidase